MSRYILGKVFYLLTTAPNNEKGEYMKTTEENERDIDLYNDMMRIGKRNGVERYMPSINILNNIFRLKRSSSLSEKLKFMKKKPLKIQRKMD